MGETTLEMKDYDFRAAGAKEKNCGSGWPSLALKEISGRLPGCKSEVCWVVRRFAPIDVADSASADGEKQIEPAAEKCLACA
jgi:hypothetical protein